MFAAGWFKVARLGPFLYMQQVRAETRKVVWPTRRESLTGFFVVLLIVALFGAFLSLANWMSFLVVDTLLELPTYWNRWFGGP